jgi:adenylate cyclase
MALESPSAGQPLPRKLAAVLFADVAGYTRLTAADEDATHLRLSESLDHMASMIERRGGRVIHYAGDAVLAMFGAVLDAVTCAVDMQREFALRNAESQADSRMEFRIGVNLGDVIEDRDDIYGEGVNVAARLHDLASPGGICVSESVRTAVGKRLPLKFTDLGRKTLKNIDHPVRVYHLNVGGTPRHFRERATALPYRSLTAAALVAASIGAGAFFIERESPVSVLPMINSIAVLPLDNLSGDPEQEYFTDGLTEALIAELGRINALEVKSRTSAMRYKITDKPLPVIARELAVDALIEGSVLRAGNDVRITLKLVHGAMDRNLWSKTFERNLRDILALQAEVARAIAAEMEITMTPARAAKLQPFTRSVSRDGLDPRAYEAYLRGRYIFNTGGAGEEAFTKAIHSYKEAIALNPPFALAHAALAEACLQPAIQFVGVFTIDDCEQAAREAIEIDGTLAEAHAALGFVLLQRWRWSESETAFKRAIELNPNSAMAHQWYMELLRVTMRFEEAYREIRRAEELDPFNLMVKTMVGWPLYDQKRFDEALAQWQKVLAIEPDFGLALYNQGLAYMFTMPNEVLTAARAAAPVFGEKSSGILGLTAVGYALQGDRSAAMATLAELETYPKPVALGWIAYVHLTLGDEEKALDWLEKSLELRSGLSPTATSEPWFDTLRGHPRFEAIRRQMGLP